jgi:fermentation-respiration switch protein FrsA (DUF1100 family)
MNSILGTLAFAAACYLILLAATFLLQPRLVYFPITRLQMIPTQVGLPYEDVSFETRDGLRLHGWYIPAQGASYTVLFFHGNAGNISHRLESLAIFHRLGLNTFIIDYRGYGNSQGSPDENGTYQDALAAWEYLRQEKQIKPDDIILFGRSLGGAVAAWLATQVNPRGLILESTFTSLPDLGADHYWFLPVRWLSRYQYDTQAHLSALSAPVLIAHSRDDRIVSFHHAQSLYAAANPPKRFLELRGGHNEGFVVSGDGYVDGLQQFVASLR